MDDRARLPLCDLAPLAVFLFGHPWQTRLARAVHRDPRTIRRWVAGERPISAAASQRIVEMVCERHGDQMRWLQASYLDMVGALSPSSFRARLLAMDLAPPPGASRYSAEASICSGSTKCPKLGLPAPLDFAPHDFAAAD